jgi:ubiquinone/menaquinone biosynthesis C-methylase UbiE
MKRIHQENKNTPDLANEIFEKRWRKQLHYVDWERFKLLSKYFSGGNFLDMACFNSPLPYELTRDYPDSKIYAIDHADRVIEHLRENFPEVNYILGDINELPFENSYFDYIVLAEAIEHSEDPQKLVREAFRAIKQGGRLALSVPNDEENNGAVSDEHLWSFTEQDIVDILTPYGDVEIVFWADSVKHIIAFCKKK